MELFFDPSGRSEVFVRITVRLSTTAADFSEALLDRIGRQRLLNVTTDKRWMAVRGNAIIAWRSEPAKQQCLADHEKSAARKRRLETVHSYAARMQSGIFPDFGHVYLHPSLTGERNLIVIDGTRRMLAFLFAGHSEMPVIAIRAREDR